MRPRFHLSRLQYGFAFYYVAADWAIGARLLHSDPLTGDVISGFEFHWGKRPYRVEGEEYYLHSKQCAVSWPKR